MSNLQDRLELLILADGKAAQREFDKTSNAAKKGLGSAEGAAKSFGLGLLAIGGTVAGVGAVITKMALDAAQDYENWGMQVRKTMMITGDSAQQASILSFQFQETGVNADQGARAIAMFSKKIEASKDPMKDFGVQTRDSSGQLLPMSTILYNVADQFSHMPDGVAKTALAMKDFGRGGAALLPFLDRGRAGLNALAVEAQRYGLVLNSQDIKSTYDAVMAHRQFDAALQGLSVTFGRDVLPSITKATVALTGWIAGITEATGKTGSDQVMQSALAKETTASFAHLGDAIKNNTALYNQYHDAANSGLITFGLQANLNRKVAGSIQDVIDWEKKAKLQTDALSQSTGQNKDSILHWLAAEAQQGVTFSNNGDALKAYDQYLVTGKIAQRDLGASVQDTTDALTAQQNEITASLDPLFAAYTDYNSLATANKDAMDAAKKYGAGSLQAQQASIALAQAAEKVYGDLINIKKGLTDGSISAAEASGALETLRQAGLIPAGSAAASAAGALQQMINKANALPTDKTMTVNVNTVQAQYALNGVIMSLQAINALAQVNPTLTFEHRGIPSHATGGMLSEGLNVVGERGAELVYKRGSSVQVYPHGTGPAGSAGMHAPTSGGAPLNVTVVVDGRAIAEAAYPHLRVYERSHR